MTTERHGSRAGVVLCFAALTCGALGCFGATRTRHGDRVDVSSYPPDVRSAYRLFALRCSRCHTLARPLNAHITEPTHWVRYVERMRRTPGSGINRHDAEVILVFLLYYTELEKREHEPQPEHAPPRPPGPSPVRARSVDAGVP